MAFRSHSINICELTKGIWENGETQKVIHDSEIHSMQEKFVLEKSILWLEAVSSELDQRWAHSKCSINVNT